MPTISMFYGILIRMFFRDADRHHMPISMRITRAKWLCIQSLMERFWRVNCLRTSANWLSHGSRFTKKICLLTGIWLSTAGSRFQLKGSTNENRRTLSTIELDLIHRCR